MIVGYISYYFSSFWSNWIMKAFYSFLEEKNLTVVNSYGQFLSSWPVLHSTQTPAPLYMAGSVPKGHSSRQRV